LLMAEDVTATVSIVSGDVGLDVGISLRTLS